MHENTATVDAPDHPGPYIGATHATMFIYKAELRLYNRDKEHMQKSIKALTSWFTRGLLIDQETDGEVIGHTVIEIYNHIKDNFLLPRDISQEITKTKTDLKVAYDPDDIVQVYYNKLQNSKLTLAALADPITDVELIRCAFETFEVQADLKEACLDWDRQVVAPT